MRAFELDSQRLPVSNQMLYGAHHERHRISRRAFMGAAAGVTGTALGAGLVLPAVAAAAPSASAAPKPTTNITALNGVDFHVTFFGPGVDPSCLTDFNGFVGVADVQGHGTATNPDGSVENLLFDTDMRFVSGVYVGQDGAVHKGTFGLV